MKKVKLWQWMLLVFMLLFFARNLVLPMISDDIPYAFVWDGADRGNLLDGVGPRERITSLGDIVRSQYSHYMTWGGRIIGIGLTQFFSWQGKLLFDVLNTLVFMGLGLLLFRIGTGKKLSEMNTVYTFWLLFALWFLLPDPFLTVLWMCGSCVFLWTAFIGLLFMLPYAKAYWTDKDPMPGKWGLPLMAFAGLCAGWAVETSAAVLDFVIFFALIWFWRQRQLRPWMVVGFVFLCIGSAMLVFAPGETVRLELQREFEYNPDLPADMYWTPLMYGINFIECFYPVVSKQLPLLLLIGYYVWHLPKGQRWNKTTRFQALLVAGSMLVMIILIFVPVAPARAGFFPTCAVIAASLAALRELQKPEHSSLVTRHSTFIKSFVAVSLVLWVVTTALCFYIDWDVRQQWMARIDYINAHQDQDVVVVHQIDAPPIADRLPDWWLYNCVAWNNDILAWGADLEPREEGSHNLMYAQYYGWKKVITDGEDRRETDSYPLLRKWFGKDE